MRVSCNFILIQITFLILLQVIVTNEKVKPQLFRRHKHFGFCRGKLVSSKLHSLKSAWSVSYICKTSFRHYDCNIFNVLMVTD